MAWAGDFVTCACGKRGYSSRKHARRAARMRSMGGVNAYQCAHPNRDAVYTWHFGHLPSQVKESRMPRSALGTTAPRTPRSSRAED